MKYRGFNCNPQYSEVSHQYFGDIEKLPEAGKISAATIDDFIRLFHQTVDDYVGVSSRAQSGNKKTGKGWIFVLVAICLVVVAALTCPSEKQHKSVLVDRATLLFEDEIEEMKQENEYGLFGSFLNAASLWANISDSISVDDYFVFNVGKFSYGGKQDIVSVGVFGHVFTISRERIRAVLQESNSN
ncbi:MAG: hypothetical protein IKO29_07955 [Bacteroidales bacterium]|nr:hypothetical protein [Bacteroidales bacterium]